MPFSITTTLIGRWIFGREFCLFHVTCDVLLCTASILHLVAIALDRFFAIHCPIKYAQTRNLTLVLGMIAAAWIISALISIPPLVGWNDMPEDPNICGYNSERGYIIYSSMGSFYIPLVILVTVYFTIFLSARRRLRKRAAGNHAPAAAKMKPVTTPQNDMASMDSPDKSDVASNTLVLSASGNLMDYHLTPRQLRRHLTAEHRRLHRRLLVFPMQSRCSACQRTQDKLLKETSLTTSSFQVMDDDFSTLSPIVDLTAPSPRSRTASNCHEASRQRVPLLKGEKNPQGDVSEDSLTPTTPMTDELPGFVNGAASRGPPHPGKSAARLFVPKHIRPKSIAKNADKAHAHGGATVVVGKNAQAAVKKHVPSTQSNAATDDVKHSLAQRQKISLTKERRAARTLLIVVLVFVICWLPFFVWYVVAPFCDTCPMDARTANFFLWLGFLNSSLNPIIYTIFNLDFRKAFKRIFRRMFPAARK
ncbi:tyramine receptor 1-like isoform X2 [Paramacrobiotus metropolitanus]|nr:tyramine receptor 1-like isoform X2 [Paramacrobiotus metropolitanus]